MVFCTAWHFNYDTEAVLKLRPTESLSLELVFNEDDVIYHRLLYEGYANHMCTYQRREIDGANIAVLYVKWTLVSMNDTKILSRPGHQRRQRC